MSTPQPQANGQLTELGKAMARLAQIEQSIKQGKNLNSAVETHVAEVVRHGTQLLIPEDMTIQQAQKLLADRATYEEQTVDFKETIPVFPWDGALAMTRVLERTFGWAQGKPVKFFGMEFNPTLISIETDVGKTVNVPWGTFDLPGVEGKLETGATRDKGVVVFQLSVSVKRKHEKFVKDFIRQVREDALANSIYRGKAVKMSFYNEQGKKRAIPEITFMDTKGVTRESAIYSRDIERRLERDLFTPITRADDMIANDVQVKTGILLTGTYGTGKTLAATVASRLAVESGLLYVYVQHANELPDAIAFARQYQSPAAVVFVEDIDRATSGDRNADMDTILNTIDGIDGKTSNIIVVLTTNDLDSINPAMIRPGRLDSIIEVTPPDAEAAERLVRKIAGTQLPPGTELTQVGAALAGSIPAVIVEVVKRAKRAQIAYLPRGAKITNLTVDGLLDAADSIKNQVEILRRATDKVVPSNAEVYAHAFSALVAADGDDDFSPPDHWDVTQRRSGEGESFSSFDIG